MTRSSAADLPAAPNRERRHRIRGTVVRLDRAFAQLLPVVTFLIAVAAVLLRQSGVPKVLTIWAEDGPIFAACAYARPLIPDCLLEPYSGWLHVIPRIGATLATLWPPAELSVALAVIAAVVAALTAVAVAIAVRDASGSWPAGLLAGTSLVLVVQAGLEVGGSLTNLHWILMAGSIVLIVASWVGAHPGPGSLAILAGAGLSSPFGPILVALGLAGAFGRRPGWRPVLVITGVTALIQLAVILTTPRVPPGIVPFDSGQVIVHLVRDVLWRGPFGPTRLPLALLLLMCLVATIVVATLLALEGRRRSSGAPADNGDSAARSLVVIAALGVTAIVLFTAELFLQHTYNPRYSYIPSVLLCVAVVFGSALLGGARSAGEDGARRFLGLAARLAFPAAALVLVLGFARTFRLEARASDGPDYSAAFRSAAVECDGADVRAIRVLISPIGVDKWVVEIPCSRVVGPLRP